MTTSAEGLQQSHGVEMRVHGVGDHGMFSALGKPVYTGSVADRVRIGSLPLLPRHELKLIHWSRPNRSITRTLSWYLAYPFTLINLAGYMGPERSDDPVERRLWWLTRAAVLVSGLMVTAAMAMWMSVIVGTVCRLLGGGARGGLADVAAAIAGPGVLACVIVHRTLRGRPLVDRGNSRVALLTLGVLLGTAGLLAGRAMSGEAVPDPADAPLGDPLTLMVGATTAIAWCFAVVLCGIAWRAERHRKGKGWASFRAQRDRTALAGAGILIAFGVVLSHAVGSGLLLALQTVLTYTPAVTQRRARGTGSLDMLPIDLAPALSLTMVAVFGALFWREYRRRKPLCGSGIDGPRGMKAAVPSHVLLRDTREFLGRTGVAGLVVSLGLWASAVALIHGVAGRSGADGLLTPALVTVKIAGLLLLVAVAVFRPEQTVVRTRWALQSFADLAGFWAPDLHPLAGASYRLAVLRGLRRGVREVRADMADRPIALVGHSQGAVLCAWFIRGGHWRERPSENCSDEHALAMRMHDNPGEPPDRIALFTCGSPLGSLYRTFFPRYVNDDFVSAVAGNSQGHIWHNYWRATDPFGARLISGRSTAAVDRARVCDVDVTEFEGEPTKGHYEYWQEGRVRRDVEEYFTAFGPLAGTAPRGQDKGGVQRRLRGLKVALPRLHLHGN